MKDAFHVVCPHCGQTNKLPSGKPPLAAHCGTCRNPLFHGHPASVVRVSKNTSAKAISRF
jgi:thioredoxin 2